jgi:hypothetical protein
MTTKTSHYGDTSTSPRHKLCLQIFKEASGPLTVMEIQDASKQLGSYLANPGTTLWEIQQNPGYEISDGTHYGQKKGPAVRFPDGKYRYWLVAAPGWIARWHITREFQLKQGTGYRVQGTEEPTENTPAKTEPIPNAVISSAQPVLICMNVRCGKELPDDHKGAPFCDEQCKNEFFGLSAPFLKKGEPGTCNDRGTDGSNAPEPKTE